MTQTLYLCYFGLREPLVQTQVLPYLREIAKDGVGVGLLTFEPDFKTKWTSREIEIERKNLAAENIDWHCLPYHKRPSAIATFYDVLRGALKARRLAAKNKIDVLHARAHIPMLMALLVKPLTGCKIVFDLRGLVAEEYVDAGIWRENSVPFRLIKRVERLGLKRSEQIVVLTRRMKDFLVSEKLKDAASIEVIPCCVDFSRIDSAETSEKSGRFTLVYAGSITGLYLLREMGEFFLELKKNKPDAFFQILTASPPETARKVFGELGIAEGDYAAAKVSPEEVPKYLKQAYLGISFRVPTFAQIAASPTKIPEYLSCGLPVVSNQGVGDTDYLLESENVGVALGGFSEKDYREALEKIDALLQDKSLGGRCRQAAYKNFDLETIGGERYRKIYRKL